MKREVFISAGIGLATALLLTCLIFIGSRNLENFDAALIAYTFAVIFASFAVVYRYAMWLQRPPTWLYFKRGWQVFFKPSYILRNMALCVQRFFHNFVLNGFIWKRDRNMGLAHFLIMWGTIISVLITFPLVFGWIHFQTPPNNYEIYKVFIFGFHVFNLDVDSWLAGFIFHGLVWASFMILPGVMLAMRKRMKDYGLMSLQNYARDIMPLLLLFSITMTGLLLWVSYTWLHGYAYQFLAITHAAVVIITLLWLPFGKFFHIFQRPAQLGVAFYKDIGNQSEQARCLRCDKEFAPLMQINDLIEVEKQLGYQYELSHNQQHYQQICPQCKRALLAISQGNLYSHSSFWKQNVMEEPFNHGNPTS